MSEQLPGLPPSQIVTEQELAVERRREKRRGRLSEDHIKCAICGWDDLLAIEQHHIGKHFLKTATMPVCQNHHVKLSALQEHRRLLMQAPDHVNARPLACFLQDMADFLKCMGDHAGCISSEDEALIRTFRELGKLAEEEGAEDAFRSALREAGAWFTSVVDQFKSIHLPAQACAEESGKRIPESGQSSLQSRARMLSDEAAECDLMPIYLRTIPLPAATREGVVVKKASPRKLSKYVVVFDTETTTCEAQRLRFGAYQVFKDRVLIQRGLFYDPTLSDADIQTIRTYADEHDAKCMTRHEFARRVVFYFGIKFKARIVGFNLPFDLTRLAIDWGRAQNDMLGGFSVTLNKSKFLPRLRMKKLGAKACHVKWSRPWEGKTGSQRKADKNTSRDRAVGSFVDVSTLAFALHSEVLSLERLAEFLQIPGKVKIGGHGGAIDENYVVYAMQDVQITSECFFKLEDQLAAHKLENVAAEGLYSPASLGKAYLSAMNIKPWREVQPDFPAAILTAIMNSFYGARSEVRHRRQIVQVRHCDFLSMYPTVYTLMDLWQILIADGVDFVDTTDETRQFVDGITIDRMLEPDTWKQLLVLVRIRPNHDLLPVRAKYGADTPSIGLNYLVNEKPQYYTLDDVVASKLQTGRTPEIVQALTFKPRRMQTNLKSVDIFGNPEYRIDPARDDFFRRVIDLRSEMKAKLAIVEDSKGELGEIERLNIQQNSLKILANSTSYGIYVEINVKDVAKKKSVDVILDGPEPDRIGMMALEDPGRYFHPLVGTLITSAARLMLTLAECLAADSGLGWAFCDTDSMAFTRPDGMPEEEFHRRVDGVQGRFLSLNPYANKGPLFQTEKVNYRLERYQEAPAKELAPLYCYAISAKRYCLCNLPEDSSILIRKASEHGLGYLMPPYDDGTQVSGIPVKPKACKGRQWHHDLWHQIVRAVIDGHPNEVDLSPLPGMESPAMSQWRISTPEMLDLVKAFNEGKDPDASIRPYNFLSGFMIREETPRDDRLSPAVKEAVAKAPFRRDPTEAASFCFNLKNGNPIQAHFLKSYRDALCEHHLASESKFLKGFRIQAGFTERRTIIAQGLIYIGKEGNKLNNVEEEDDALHGDVTIIYGRMRGEFSYVAAILDEAVRTHGMGEISNRLGIQRWTVADIIDGKQAPPEDLIRSISELIECLGIRGLPSCDENERRVALLRKHVERFGTDETAQRLTVSRGYISSILADRRNIGRKLAARVDALAEVA